MSSRPRNRFSRVLLEPSWLLAFAALIAGFYAHFHAGAAPSNALIACPLLATGAFATVCLAVAVCTHAPVTEVVLTPRRLAAGLKITAVVTVLTFAVTLLLVSWIAWLLASCIFTRLTMWKLLQPSPPRPDAHLPVARARFVR